MLELVLGVDSDGFGVAGQHFGDVDEDVEAEEFDVLVFGFGHLEEVAEDGFDLWVFEPDFGEPLGKGDEPVEGVFDNGEVVVLQQLVEVVEPVLEVLSDLVGVFEVRQAAEHQSRSLPFSGVATFQNSSYSLSHFLHHPQVSALDHRREGSHSCFSHFRVFALPLV